MASVENSEEIDQVSAGGVVFRECDDKQIRIVLLRDQNTHKWILPKGRNEEGESLEETSLREVQEETGLKNLKFINKIDKTNYWFKTKSKEKLQKEVHFYLYKDENINGDICVEEEFFDKGQWFTKYEAIEIIAFQNQRKILHKAFQMIEEGTL